MVEIASEYVQISHQDVQLEVYYAYQPSSAPQPAVLVFPTWAGRDKFCREKAHYFAQMGYVGVALDLYGQGRVGSSPAENSALMEPFVHNREFLKDRIKGIMDHLTHDSRIDSQNIVGIGYCFGGLCVLDAVRNNLGLKGAVSVHGLFTPPTYPLPETYKAKVLALHGYKDPMVPPNEIEALQKELSRAKTDFQLMIYGTGYHAFTNPAAHDYNMGTVYDSLLDHRSKFLINDFIREIFLHS